MIKDEITGKTKGFFKVDNDKRILKHIIRYNDHFLSNIKN